MNELGEPALVEVLGKARRAVDEFRQRRELQGHDASEEEQTVCLCDAAWPRVQYAQFNRRQEARVGADWLWWFVDGSGECFGVLIQAKRLRGHPGNWEIDLAYPKQTGDQLQKLLGTADALEVPAAYVVYFGDVTRRSDLRCGKHADDDCDRCVRSTVAILSALAAAYALRLAMPYHPEELVPDAYRYSLPLEDLAQPASQRVFDLNLPRLPLDLKEFLMLRQTGARAVAKHIFEVAAKIRMGQFGAAARELTRVGGQQVFQDLPADVGHGGPPYWVHTLRGLRTSLPDYVAAFLDDPNAATPPPLVGALAVVHM